LPVKTKAKPIVTLSSNIFSVFQLGTGIAKDEPAFINEDPVSIKRKVDDSVFKPIEFDDTAELKLDDSTEIAINKGIVSKLFPDHFLFIIDEDDVILDTVSYPDTIDECIKVISKLRHREKDLHLINTDNVIFLGHFQADAVSACHLFEKEHIDRDHWEGEYHRYFQEVQRLDEEGNKNHRNINELNELVQSSK